MTTENDEKFRAMRERLADVLPRLNERDHRVALATEATSWGYGGISAVRRATGVSWTTMKRGMTELSGILRVTGGFDCSGLTKAAYAAAGMEIPRTAQTQYNAGPHVPAGQPVTQEIWCSSARVRTQ